MTPVKLILADDHTLVRAGLRALAESIEGVQVVAEADNGADAVALANAHRPDIVMMDISMKELNGIEAAARIKAGLPHVHVVFLSMHTGGEFVRRALKAGGSAYLVKDSAPLELSMALEAVMRGEMYLSPRVSRDLVAGLVNQEPGEQAAPVDALTPRQLGILTMIAEGRSTKQIAYDLKLSVKTVETHRAALMERLGIHDVAGLVVYAVRNALISVELPAH